MPFRFVHTSDVHLGKRFGTYPESIRGRLVEARHGALQRVAQVAQEHGARHILVAGDLFDSETPSPDVWRQAFSEMSSYDNLEWVIIPGNHDSLVAETLWERANQYDAVRLLTDSTPVVLAQGVTVLPAPMPSRFPGLDLTGWMMHAETSPDHLRIGLAHGGIAGFGEDAEVIPPDRAEKANLDYLALGDWHGQLRITDRTWYSGSPERDGFKHGGRGACLVVTLTEPGEAPEVTPVETGRFDWHEIELPLTPQQNAVRELNAALEAKGSRRDMLRKVVANGWVRLPQRSALESAGEELAPEFGVLEVRMDDLGTEYAVDDLDAISTGGALRVAADDLYEQSENSALSAEDREIAGAALRRLYNMVVPT